MTLPDRDYAQWILEGLCLAALLILVATMVGCAQRPRPHACEVRRLSERDRAALVELWAELSMEDENMVGRGEE